MDNFHITEAAMASMLGQPLRSIQGMRKRGEGPACTKIGRSYFYTEEAISEWVARKSSTPFHRKLAVQSDLIREFFPKTEDDNGEGLELAVNGRLTIHVREDGQTFIGFTGEEGTALTFDCWGFKRAQEAIWSTGDVTIYRIGGSCGADQ